MPDWQLFWTIVIAIVTAWAIVSLLTLAVDCWTHTDGDDDGLTL